MSVERLQQVTQWTQARIAQFVGVKQPTVHAWLHGKAKPAGVNRMVINIALIIADRSPEILRHVCDIEPSTKPFDRVVSFFGDEVGVAYWLDITPYEIYEHLRSDAMGRLAVMLDLISVLMPDVQEQMLKAFPVVVAQRRASRAESLRESENKAKARRKAKLHENRILREL